jgi:hypothetical protein
MTPWQLGFRSGQASEQNAIRYEVLADRLLTALDVTRSERIAILEQAEVEARTCRGYTDEAQIRAYAACRVTEAFCRSMRERIPALFADGLLTVGDLMPYLEFMEARDAAE